MRMIEYEDERIRRQARFRGIFDTEVYKKGRFERNIPVSAFKMHDECMEYVKEAIESGFDGSQINALEERLARFMGLKYAVAVSSGEAATHLALKLAAEKLYGSSTGIRTPDGPGRGGSLQGKKVFCQDLTTADMVNPVVFEGGEPIFIDSAETGSWSMSPEVLEMAFRKYPDVKIVIINHVYGFPGDALAIRKLCFENDALLIECAGDALGAEYWVPQTNEDGGVWGRAGALGDFCVLDFAPDLVLGPAGGALLTRSWYEAEKARYWAGGANAATPWNQMEELGYNYRLGDADAAVLRGGIEHIFEAVTRKKAIYEKYREKLEGPMAYTIPEGEGTKPNYWMTCMTTDSDIRFIETRNDRDYMYKDVNGTAAPMEIYEALNAFGVECRTVYKPMSMQPVYRNNEHFTLDGPWRMYEDFSNDTFCLRCDRAKEYYECGIVLPSDIGMTDEEQDKIIDIIYACYDKSSLKRLAWAG